MHAIHRSISRASSIISLTPIQHHTRSTLLYAPLTATTDVYKIADSCTTHIGITGVRALSSLSSSSSSSSSSSLSSSSHQLHNDVLLQYRRYGLLAACVGAAAASLHCSNNIGTVAVCQPSNKRGSMSWKGGGTAYKPPHKKDTSTKNKESNDIINAKRREKRRVATLIRKEKDAEEARRLGYNPVARAMCDAHLPFINITSYISIRPSPSCTDISSTTIIRPHCFMRVF